MIRVVLAGELPALARELRDRGVEVVYTGPASPEHVAATALQEDPDAVVAAEQADEVAALLARLDAADVPVIAPDDALTWVDTAGDRTHHPR
ncbi:hypothetical protein ACFQV2_34895 [Actinokineospora soli]|uniref:Uncharacterized protein n=1 Tax=Actinokineospora soli TaxID=1048753 RepID=A0ABW2TYK4_9PSEU